MVYEILATTPFGKEKKGEVGIERMVEEGAYSAAFPLHDVSNAKAKPVFANFCLHPEILVVPTAPIGVGMSNKFIVDVRGKVFKEY